MMLERIRPGGIAGIIIKIKNDIELILKNIFKLYSSSSFVAYIECRFKHVSREHKKYMFANPASFNVIPRIKCRWYLATSWEGNFIPRRHINVYIPIIMDIAG